MNTIEPQKIYTESETANWLRIKPSTLAAGRCRKDSPLPWVKVGKRRIGYIGQDILNLIDKGRMELPTKEF
ncbi:MAG: hypothetical protein EBQ92_00025 [Proteobacteria bacterium]|nr:hypothetical protein [Pseudomonadota bacterium]